MTLIDLDISAVRASVITPSITAALAPLTGNAPAGPDYKDLDSEAVETLEELVGTLQRDGVGRTNLGHLIDAGFKVLADETKDLRIASPVVLALYERDGLEGLAKGLILLEGLISAFPDMCFPRNPRSRAGEVEFALKRALPALMENAQAVDAKSAASWAILLDAAKRLKDIFDGYDLPRPHIATRLYDSVLRPGEEAIPLLQERYGRATAGEGTEEIREPASDAAEAASGSLEDLAIDAVEAPTTGEEGGPERAIDTYDGIDLTPFRAELDASVLALVAPLSGAGGPTGLDPMELESEAYEEFVTCLDVYFSEGAGRAPLGDLIANAKRVLARDTKDLGVAAGLALGLFHKQGFAGWVGGVVLIADLLTSFGEVCHPRAVRLRPGRIADAVNRPLGVLENGEVAPTAENAGLFLLLADAVEKIAARLDVDGIPSPHIGRTLRDAVGPSARQAADLIRRSREADAASPAPAPAPIETPEDASPSNTAYASPPSPSRGPANGGKSEEPNYDLTDEADLRRVLRDIPQNSGKAATVLLDADPADPRYVQLLVVSSWLDIDSLPPTEGSDNVTPVPPPQADSVTVILGALRGGEFSFALKQACFAMRDSPFWLDPFRIAVEACDGMGESQARVRDALKGALAGIVTRFPDILSYKFAGGMPFADAETAAWVGETIGAAGGATERDPAAIAAGQALALLKTDRTAGLKALANFDGQAGGGLRRYRWQLLKAQTLMLADLPGAAASIFDSLLETADHQGLDRWDPDLVVPVLVGRLQADALRTQTADFDPEAERRRSRWRDRLCTLDLAAAETFLT